MCGILGIFNYGKLSLRKENKRREAALFLATEILRLMKDRGEDATGIASLFADGSFAGLKMPVPSDEFVSRFGDTKDYYDGHLDLLRDTEHDLKIMIGHCRKSSVGNSSNSSNMHPIKVRNMCGVHNGTLKNHENIFKKLAGGRDGTVDSEAIIRLLQHFSNEGRDPWCRNNVIEVTNRLEGTFSVLAFNGNNPNQVVGFRDDRPMDLAWIKPLQMMVVASDKKYIEKALYHYNLMVNVYGNPHKLPHLGKDEVKFKYTQNESLIIFNLETEINDDTEIDKLYDTEKLPSRVEKLWTTKFHSNASKPKTHVQSAAEKKWEKEQKEAKLKAGNNTSSSGKGWSRKFNKYTDISDEEIAAGEEIGTVEMSKTVVSEVVDEIPDVDLSEVEEVANKNNHKSDNKIIQLPGPKSAKEDKGEPAVVDMEPVDAELLKEASEAIKELDRYESTADVMTGLGIENADMVTSMAPFVLCNRARKQAFIDGFVKARQVIADVNDVRGFIPLSKLKAGEKDIRFLKSVVGIVAKTMNSVSNSSRNQLSHLIKKSVNEAIERNKEINISLFDTVFKEGDVRSSDSLKLLREVLESKENS